MVEMGEGVDKKQRKMIEVLSEGIVNKILHKPVTHLRSDGNAMRTLSETIVYTYALERIFDLSEVSGEEVLVR